MFAAVVCLAVASAPPPSADMVLVGGKVWRGPGRPDAQAVAVWRGRVVHVGTDAEALALAAPGARTVRLDGRRVAPGFHDSHVHWLAGGQSLSEVDLKGAADEAEFGRRLTEFDRKLPRDRWIVGGNWDHDRTFGGALPTAAVVDRYVKDRPVFISRYDGHMALANTAAMKLAGVSSETKAPPGGVVFRLPDGRTPSGVFKDNAMGLVARLVPGPDESAIREAVLAAQKLAAEVGVTSVQDMDGSSRETRRRLFRTLQRLARAGELTCRVDLRWPLDAHADLAALGVEADFGSNFVRIGGVKGFMDGSLGSSTARMFAPYEGDAKNVGVYVTPPEKMRALIRSADAAGLNVAVHAIGDEANAVLLDLFEQVAKENGPRDRRFRVEHAQHLRPAEYGRFPALGVVASMQPYHVVDDGRWAEGRIGPARCASSYAYRSLLDHGARLAFGSDWPVAPLSPLAGVDAAVNRRTLDGRRPGGWFPEQRLTVAEALAAYTAGSAFAAGQERERGAIEPGRLADLVVLSRDVLAPEERDRIAAVKVDLTILDGRVVFERR